MVEKKEEIRGIWFVSHPDTLYLYGTVGQTLESRVTS